MWVLLVLSSFLCCGLCEYNQIHLQEEWLSWKRQHSKSYYNPREEGSRWAVWRANYQLIQEHNRANHSFTLGLNEFADLVSATFDSRSCERYGENVANIVFLYRHKKSLLTTTSTLQERPQSFPAVA